MRPNTLRSLRRYHHYVGVFFAPMILLFAISGALQTFRLQETRGYGGLPPTWIMWLASVHKDQGPPRPPRPERPGPAAAAGHADHDQPRDAAGPAAKRPSPLPLKIFVVLLAVALAVSTVMGIVIALAMPAMRRVSVVLLVLGAVLPCVLLWL